MSEVTEIAEKLKSEGEKMISIFNGLNDGQWHQEVYTEGTTWTIRNVLSHFVTSERGLVKLFEQIRQGGAGSPDDFSIDRYNAAMQDRTRELSPQELLKQYRQVRAEPRARPLADGHDQPDRPRHVPTHGESQERGEVAREVE